jgi:hypothetical protein
VGFERKSGRRQYLIFTLEVQETYGTSLPTRGFRSGKSFKPEIELEIVQPRDVRIDSFVPQFVGKVFIMAAQELGVGAF